MYKHGHIGLSLAAAAPIAIIFGYFFGPQWATLTLVFSFITSRVPDFDHRTELLAHRGFTHTIWFAIIISLAGALIITQISTIAGSSPENAGITLSNMMDLLPTFAMTFSGFMIGFISHLIGDIITEAYDYTVNPFWPVSNKAYTLSWTKADSKVWNWGLLLLGVASTGITIITIFIW